MAVRTISETVLNGWNINFFIRSLARISVMVRSRVRGHSSVVDFLADYRVYLGALMHC